MHSIHRALALTAFTAVFAGIASAQYTVTVLHPSGAFGSNLSGVNSTSQVGQVVQYDGVNPSQYGAGMWNGSAVSFIPLHPAGFQSSSAQALDGGFQYGWVYNGAQQITTAARWQGIAGSYVSIHPLGYIESEVFGSAGGQQIGIGTVMTPDENNVPYSAPHALIWNGGPMIDLNPAGAWSSIGYGIAAGTQVGSTKATRTSDSLAALWKGSAASYQNIHPAGFSRSEARATDGNQSVGYGAPLAGGLDALLWQGSPAVATDLNPAGADGSTAMAVGGGMQAGWVIVGGVQKAALWKGSAASYTDLQQYLPAGYTQSTATAIDSQGRIYGYALTIGATPNGNFTTTHAVVWVPDAVAPSVTLGNFAQPINDPATHESVFKYGRTVPVKIQLLDSNKKPVSGAVITISVTKLGTVETAVNESSITTPADSGSTFRYDVTSGQYIYNLGTGGLQSGCRYRITATVNGTSLTHSVTVGIH